MPEWLFNSCLSTLSPLWLLLSQTHSGRHGSRVCSPPSLLNSILLKECMLAWFSRVLKGFEVFKCRPIDFFFFFFKLSQLWLKHSGLGVNKSVVSFLATTGDVLLSQTQLSDKGHVPKQWAICKACSDKRISVVMSAERDFFFFF